MKLFTVLSSKVKGPHRKQKFSQNHMKKRPCYRELILPFFIGLDLYSIILTTLLCCA